MHIIIPVIAALAVWTGIIAMILRGLHHAARVRNRIDAAVPAEPHELAHRNTTHDLEQPS